MKYIDAGCYLQQFARGLPRSGVFPCVNVYMATCGPVRIKAVAGLQIGWPALAPNSTKAPQDEKQIIEKVIGGQVAEYRVLVERYQNPIYSLMLRLTGSVQTAEDLTQDVFMRAYENLHKFNNNRRLFPWLYTIAINRCRDYLRRKGIRRSIFSDDHGAFPSADPDGEKCTKRADCALEIKLVSEAMQKLPFIYREALLLFYREELSLKEMASAMGITVHTAKIRLHRGRDLLRYLLGEKNEVK